MLFKEAITSLHLQVFEVFILLGRGGDGCLVFILGLSFENRLRFCLHLSLLFTAVLVALFVYFVLACILDLNLLQLNYLFLLDAVHVRVFHVIDFVGGAGGENNDTLENCNDKLSIQTGLQEGIHLRLLYNLFKFVKLDHFRASARHSIPQIPHLDTYNLIPHTTQRN